MDLVGLYNNAHNITKEMSHRNKYTFLAYLNILKGRYLDINDVLTNDLDLGRYIERHGEIMLFPNYVNGKMVDIFIRPIDNLSTPLTYKLKDLPYGIGNLTSNFKYGDTIFVVEGIADYGALKLIDKDINVIALRTNGFPKSMYGLLASITNNIVMIPDSDEAGHVNIKKATRRFKELGVTFSYFEQYYKYKDTGDFATDVLEYTKTKSIELKEDIELASKYYINNIILNGGLKKYGKEEIWEIILYRYEYAEPT